MKKEMTNDMTVGSPAKLIIQFMIPMCLGNVFQQFYNIADSIIAGQFLGVNALAAIGSTGSLMFFVTGWLQRTDQWLCNSGIPVVWGKRYETDASLCGNVHLSDGCICIGDDHWI